MPEGDALHRAARLLQPLVGQRVEVETPNPRAAVKQIAERLDGRMLESVEAVGKNLLLRFEGGLVLRSHLRMTGRWRLDRRGTVRRGKPWLVLRGAQMEGVLWNGPVLELRRDSAVRRRLGPDILEAPPRTDEMVAGLRREPPARQLGDALLDQRLVAGIGTVWRAEALWAARLSPWRPLGDVRDEELRTVLGEAARQMRASLEGGRTPRQAYGRAGRACRRCGTPIRSWLQGDDARLVFWCPKCQLGHEPSAGPSK
jgi:endonuclease VIII